MNWPLHISRLLKSGRWVTDPICFAAEKLDLGFVVLCVFQSYYHMGP